MAMTWPSSPAMPPPGVGASAIKKAAIQLAIDEIDSLTVRGYLGRLHRKNEKVTIARKLSALRSFFRHLVKHRLADEDPTAAILTPKHSRRMPSYLSVDDMFRLLDQTSRRHGSGTAQPGHVRNPIRVGNPGLRTDRPECVRCGRFFRMPAGIGKREP
jgi:hypothetical protein